MNVRSRKSKTADVLIVGAGPLGWACAHLLSQKNINTVVVDPALKNSSLAWADRGINLFWPSLNDPPTRAVVAHGTEMALWLQNYCKHGVELVPTLFAAKQIQKIDCIRIGLHPHEAEELDKACELNLGLRKSTQPSKFPIYEESSHGFLYVPPSSSTTKKNSVNNSFLTVHSTRCVEIDESKDHCITILDSGEKITSEMVILANGYQISTFEPWLKNMLVPMSDVCTLWSTNVPCEASAKPFAVRAASGHVAAVFNPCLSQNSHKGFWNVRMTGPRFMLPSAGVGLDLSGQPVEKILVDKIQTWLTSQLLPALTEKLGQPHQKDLQANCTESRFGVDCLPCDELPILGDVGRQGRILASTGWLGCGWSASLQSASIIIEIIETGTSAKLASLLRPKRWRSGLADDGVTGMT